MYAIRSYYESSGTGLCNGCFPESAFGNLSVAIEIAVNLSMTDLSGQEVDAAVSDLQQAMNSFLDLVITSYSIHYTKLYEYSNTQPRCLMKKAAKWKLS